MYIILQDYWNAIPETITVAIIIYMLIPDAIWHRVTNRIDDNDILFILIVSLIWIMFKLLKLDY